MTMKVKGTGTDVAALTSTWPIRAPNVKGRIRGTIGGRAIDLRAPAPSYD
jgi:hypothetical protein